MVSWLVHDAFRFSGQGVLGVVHNLLFLVVLLVAVASIVFAIPAERAPALRGVDALLPHATAVLVLWVPAQIVLLTLGHLIHMKAGFNGVLLGARALVSAVAYFGVLLVTAPEAYDEVKRMMAAGGSYPPGGGHPGNYPQAGVPPQHPSGYPQHPGGYPPQGG
jgi:hypothetical protein